MTIIYYLLVSLFRWDMKWIIKLSSMWGITRLLLVILSCATLFIDSYLIHNRVTHIQRINVQLKRLEPCLQIVDNKPNKQLEWGLVRKLEQSEWELRTDTEEVCKRANIIQIGKRLDAAFLEVLGVSGSQVKDSLNVELPNGNKIGSIPKGTTKEQIKQIAIKSGLAEEIDFTATNSEKNGPWNNYH